MKKFRVRILAQFYQSCEVVVTAANDIEAMNKAIAVVEAGGAEDDAYAEFLSSSTNGVEDGWAENWVTGDFVEGSAEASSVTEEDEEQVR